MPCGHAATLTVKTAVLYLFSHTLNGMELARCRSRVRLRYDRIRQGMAGADHACFAVSGDLS